MKSTFREPSLIFYTEKNITFNIYILKRHMIVYRESLINMKELHFQDE